MIPASLTVYFDGDCPFCTRMARWLRRQPSWVPLRVVAAQAAAGRECPLTLDAMLERITVVADTGAVYRGTNGWLMCLWALRRYRGWALRMSHPTLRPAAERMFGWIAGLAERSKRRASPA